MRAASAAGLRLLPPAGLRHVDHADLLLDFTACIPQFDRRIMADKKEGCLGEAF